MMPKNTKKDQADSNEEETAFEKLTDEREIAAQALILEAIRKLEDLSMDGPGDLAFALAKSRDPDPYLRAKAIETLARSSDPKAVDRIVEALHDKDDFARMASMEVLEEIDRPDTLPILRAAMNDPELLIRVTAYQTLALRGDTSVKERLRQIIKAADDYEQAQAYMALHILGEHDAVDEIVKLLESPDYRVRASMANSVSLYETEDNAQKLRDIFKKLAEEEEFEGTRDDLQSAVDYLAGKFDLND